MKEKSNLLLIMIMTLTIAFLIVAGCGQDPSKLPPDQLLQKAIENMVKNPGAFEAKETFVSGSGTSSAKVETSGVIDASVEKSYLKTKGLIAPDIDTEVFYEKAEKDVYIRMLSGGASILTKFPKDIGKEYMMSFGVVFLRDLQDPKKLTDLKTKQEGDQLVVEAKAKDETIGSQGASAQIRYLIDRKMMTLQRIEVSINDPASGQFNGSYIYKAGLQVPLLTSEEKAKAIQR